MTSQVVEVESLSKLYRIGLAEQRAETLAGALAGFVRSPWQNFKKLRALADVSTSEADSEDVIWALHDVSFSVSEGEVLGIIGANGAGKSTLLKVLAGITEPTEGRAILRGRVASLLEVGTGFHADLTGRENVYLNGTILGMKKVEIDRRFDEIVAFSGVQRFIDTPVKRYSSGMRVRLAFAVAAHLEPEILLVDEVLAVGDLRFQEKCIGKMGEVARGGRTVLFVSHNLAAVKQLCARGILLDEGRAVDQGPVADVIRRYKERFRNGNQPENHPSDHLRILGMWIGSPGQDTARSDSGFVLGFSVEVPEPLESLSLRVSVRNSDDQLVVHSRLEDSKPFKGVHPGRYRCRVHLPSLWLTPGEYGVQVKALAVFSTGVALRAVSDPFVMIVINDALLRRELPGILTPVSRWDVEAEESPVA